MPEALYHGEYGTHVCMSGTAEPDEFSSDAILLFGEF
jgi:hypothetical protein